MPDARPRLAVFVSGTGRTLRNLVERIGDGELPATIALVAAWRACSALDVAREHAIPHVVISPDVESDELGGILRRRRIDWVVLAGYTRLLPIPEGYEGRMVNIHPALLPNFGGPGMYGMRVHEAVLQSGATESGCTVHLCDERYDTGPIVEQRRCPVRADDTPESLAARVFELEREAYPSALRRLLAGEIGAERRPADKEAST